MELSFDHVGEAFTYLVDLFDADGNLGGDNANFAKTSSRAGDVIQYLRPATITFESPRNRVLINSARDANPFFHLYEAMWMLAGRNDVASPVNYNSKFGQFSDDGKIFNGAYGYRWRHAVFYWYPERNGFDQLDILIKHLIDKPDSRRAVLQMWNVEDDLLKIDSSKDVCCNTAVYFTLREVSSWDRDHFSDTCYLDMTVTNRSNDLIWGMLGANVVHFSFLQEYVAGCLGVSVGRYHQFTNNLHVYTNNNSGWHPEEWLQADTEVIQAGRTTLLKGVTKEEFDREVNEFVDANDGRTFIDPNRYKSDFLRLVAQPMLNTYAQYKLQKEADYPMYGDRSRARNWRDYVNKIGAEDWRRAAELWIGKRLR